MDERPNATEHPNARRTRQILDAAARGDMEAYRRMLGDDVVLHFPGSNRLTGDYEGKEGVFRFFGLFAEATNNTLNFEVLDFLASDARSATLGHLTAERAGKRLDAGMVEVRLFDADGLVTDVRAYPEETVALDEFLS